MQKMDKGKDINDPSSSSKGPHDYSRQSDQIDINGISNLN